jgi:hypothetical protein
MKNPGGTLMNADCTQICAALISMVIPISANQRPIPAFVPSIQDELI